jgi:hypothetical protein
VRAVGHDSVLRLARQRAKGKKVDVDVFSSTRLYEACFDQERAEFWKASTICATKYCTRHFLFVFPTLLLHNCYLASLSRAIGTVSGLGRQVDSRLYLVRSITVLILAVNKCDIVDLVERTRSLCQTNREENYGKWE